MTKIPTATDLSKMPSAELRKGLARALDNTAASLYEAAAIWAELDRRGDAPRSRIGQFLSRIHRGELAPELMLAFSTNTSIMKGIVGMPLEEQRRLAEGGTIAVAAFDANGKTTTEEKSLAQLTAREAKLAIDGGKVRPIVAQVNSLKRTRSEAATRPVGTYSKVSLIFDPATGFISVGHARLRPTDFREVFRQAGWTLVRLEPKRQTASASTQAELRP